MGFDNTSTVGHTTQADLYGVTVEDFAEGRVLLEVLVDQPQESLPNACSHTSAVRRVEPNNISSPLLSSFRGTRPGLLPLWHVRDGFLVAAGL